MKLEEGGVVYLFYNKASKVHGIGTVRLKMFNHREFLLHNLRYVPKLKWDLLSVSMFDDLRYCTRFKHGVLKISHGEVIIAKGYKTYRLYILEGFNVVVNSSSASEDFHEKKTLWDLRSRHCGWTKTGSKHFNEFCIRQRIKTHLSVELSCSRWGKVGI